ncbi:helix-turn-helix domain-containing protein [Vibrio crassostreae]|uniref:helix-turn-helix domain-containing protein n=1 Tax=Vibrio crassostreae TaxID=246167 RepID=UPI000638AD0E|nr:helix-turn-helix domain-containing protein [Vibrio crassostreae]TCO01559.1 helix-turn-helix protein [Vibrio crassostreae]TCT51329.1 helix-turn-helix protein [Vibrio crassostreae]TCT70260.1 helix-turn-helix protein [Vibrio crassostreae]TCT76158.1 helix-turn-helix protein [Vibrio crassostreae]TCT95348.1 helix-turn-helix protein [Vibrio crassostreae]
MCVSLILSFIPLKTGSPISKLVLLKLADNADARGVCFPSFNYLAQYCEVSVRTVKRHVNALEKQGFVKRIKRFDDSGRQRSNIYQLRLPSDSHIQQAELDQANTNAEQTGLPQASLEYPKKTDHSDTPLGDSRSSTESDHPAHIIFHKEHKTELSLKNGLLDDADVLDPPSGSEQHESSPFTSKPKSKTKNEAVIHLLTQEGSAPIYHEFTTILERTYPKLDVLQELHAMQAWLYINPDKRKPFEHIGHFVNGWLRRSAQAKAKRDSSPVFKQTRAAKPARASAFTSTKEAKTQPAAKPMDPKQPTPVSQALADYKAKSTTNPFEARIKALVQSKSPGTDSKS